MERFDTHQAPRHFSKGTAVAIGIFDGVHLGHQALLNKAVALARQDALKSLAYTFHPHPARVLNEELAPQLIEPLAARLQRMEALGLDGAFVQAFTRNFAATSAEAFVVDILVKGLRAQHVVVGAGFTFGSRQRGNITLLQSLGQEYGFTVHPVEHVRADGIEVSSTKIREFVHTGQPHGATLLLGRPFALMGLVETGARRGTGIGFPTANIRVENELIPAGGVYAGYATLPAGARHVCVVNLGHAPTFGDSPHLKVEAHLLNYTGEPLYSQRLVVELLEYLREEQRFGDVEALKAQIHQDVLRTRKLLTS